MNFFGRNSRDYCQGHLVSDNLLKLQYAISSLALFAVWTSKLLILAIQFRYPNALHSWKLSFVNFKSWKISREQFHRSTSFFRLTEEFNTAFWFQNCTICVILYLWIYLPFRTVGMHDCHLLQTDVYLIKFILMSLWPANQLF